MEIRDAVSQVSQFKGRSLAATVAELESRLSGAEASGISPICRAFHVDLDLLAAAAAVKRASAQIDVVIHTLGIVYSLPHILQEGEVVEGVSLGAGSAGSDFDLETNVRIAEFKFINWQGGSEAVRKKTLFQDYFKLAREETPKDKYLYLLNVEIPVRFLSGTSNTLRLLDRNKRLRDDFLSRYGQLYRTVGEFYAAHKEEIQLVNLKELVPELDVLLEGSNTSSM